MKSKTLRMLSFICWAIACIVLSLLVGTWADAAQAKFSWLPNTEPDLAGYKIYSDVEDLPNDKWNPENVIDVGFPEIVDGRVVYVIKDVPDIKMTYAATAYDMDGNESDFSSHVTYNPAPLPPADLQATVVNINITVN